MDLFQKLKAEKAARDAAKAAAEKAAQPSLAQPKPAPAPPATPATPAAPPAKPTPQGFTLNRPAVQPNRRPVLPLRSSQAAPENDVSDFSGIDVDNLDFDAEEAPDNISEIEDAVMASFDDDIAEEPEPEPEPPAPPASPLAALSAVRRRPAVQAVHHAEPVAPKPAEPPAHAAPAAPQSEGAAMLASLRARAAQQASGLQRPAAAPAGYAAHVVARGVSDYTLEQFMEDWPGEDAVNDATDMDEIHQMRAELLTRMAQKLNTMFMAELESIGTGHKPMADIATAEISKIAKLCFMRVKEAPSAYDMLDQVDRDAFIKALLYSAARRQEISKSRKPKEAKELSNALETLAQADDGLRDALSDFSMEF